MTPYQFWRHKTSGEVWAVELDNRGDVIGTAGPLHHTEVEDVELSDFFYDDEDVDWIKEHEDEFVLHEKQ